MGWIKANTEQRTTDLHVVELDLPVRGGLERDVGDLALVVRGVDAACPRMVARSTSRSISFMSIFTQTFK